MLGLGSNRTAVPAQGFCDLLDRSPDCVRLGACVAWLSHAIPRRPAGSRSSRGPGGELRLVWVMVAAIAGALLGDGSAFWIGHRTQREILSSWPMSNYPRVVAQSEGFFHRWGALAVFFARFVPPIRAFVPITAGALGMPPLRFFAVNIPAILLWAPAHVLPGVLAVSALDRYAGISHHTGIGKHYWMLIVVGGALVVALAVWIIRRRHGGGVIEPATAAARKDP